MRIESMIIAFPNFRDTITYVYIYMTDMLNSNYGFCHVRFSLILVLQFKASINRNKTV